MSYKPLEITVNDPDEFQEMINNKDFKICKSIVEGVLANIETKKQHIHVLSVVNLEDNKIYDLTLDRRYFVETLEDNLKHYITQELYEECSKIVDIINILKENK
jgi:protein-arginine kinase activator protein McsA